MKRLFPLLLTFVMIGCGGDDSTGPEETFDKTFEGNIAALGYESHAVTASGAGTLRAVLTWPDASNDLDLFLTHASCTLATLENCEVLAIDDDVEGNEEEIQHAVTSGQQLKVWVDSYADVATSYTLRVTIN